MNIVLSKEHLTDQIPVHNTSTIIVANDSFDRVVIWPSYEELVNSQDTWGQEFNLRQSSNWLIPVGLLFDGPTDILEGVGEVELEFSQFLNDSDPASPWNSQHHPPKNVIQ